MRIETNHRNTTPSPKLASQRTMKYKRITSRSESDAARQGEDADRRNTTCFRIIRKRRSIPNPNQSHPPFVSYSIKMNMALVVFLWILQQTMLVSTVLHVHGFSTRTNLPQRPIPWHLEYSPSPQRSSSSRTSSVSSVFASNSTWTSPLPIMTNHTLDQSATSLSSWIYPHCPQPTTRAENYIQSHPHTHTQQPIVGLVFHAWSQVLQWEESKYTTVLDYKCPFLRRRASDMLDALDSVLENLYKVTLLPHDTTSSTCWTPIAWRKDDRRLSETTTSSPKLLHLSDTQFAQLIHRDWKVHSQHQQHKGYYVTGRINTQLYANDCVFEGPDPDMPVKGLRKYANAAGSLFCPKTSTCELIQLEQIIVSLNEKEEEEPQQQYDLLQATWKFQGTLRFPWRPKLPTVYGTTTYHRRASDGLIERHAETWDNMNAWQAFWKTFVDARWTNTVEDDDDDDTTEISNNSE